MNYTPIICFIAAFSLTSSIVLAEGVITIFPILLILLFSLYAITYSLLENLLVAYLSVRFFIKKRIKDESHFLKFILKNTVIFGMFEIVLVLMAFRISNYLLSVIVYSVLNGIITFFAFKYLLSKELKIGKRRGTRSLFILNPLPILLILYILSFILIQ